MLLRKSDAVSGSWSTKPDEEIGLKNLGLPLRIVSLRDKRPGEAGVLRFHLFFVALLIFRLTEKMLDYFSFHRRIYDRQGSDGAENQREKRESRNQQRRTLMLIETDHDLAQDEDQGCIDDKR